MHVKGLLRERVEQRSSRLHVGRERRRGRRVGRFNARLAHAQHKGPILLREGLERHAFRRRGCQPSRALARVGEEPPRALDCLLALRLRVALAALAATTALAAATALAALAAAAAA